MWPASCEFINRALSADSSHCFKCSAASCNEQRLEDLTEDRTRDQAGRTSGVSNFPNIDVEQDFILKHRKYVHH